MWIEEQLTKNGTVRYKFVERYKDPITKKCKKASLVYDDKKRTTIKNAMAALHDKIAQLTRQGQYADITLEAALKEYTAAKTIHQKISTQRIVKQQTDVLLNMFPRDIVISSLSLAIVQKAFDEFYKEHSYSYTKGAKSLLARTLKHAKRMGYVADVSFIDDIELIRKPKTLEDVERERGKALSKRELAVLLKELYKINPDVSLICEFQALTGLRYGELAALQTHEYDSEKKCIHVSATLSLFKGTKALIRNTAKNVYSIRTVSLDDRAVEIIEQFIHMNKARKEWSRTFHDTNHIFVTNGGYPFDISYVNRMLRKVSPHKQISTHTFRHTHISLLAESNVPLKAIMERVGHNDPRTTLSVYTHVTQEMKNETIKALLSISNDMSTEGKVVK